MTQSHLRAIDGVRAFAVTAVILYHFFPALAPNGFLGVDIFFVVSGFVISRAFWHWRPQRPAAFLLEFYARRLRRLLPALAVCIAASCALLLLLAVRFDKDALFTAGAAMFGLSNLLLNALAQDYFALDAQVNPFTHTWSLGVEEQFYLVFPLLALLLGIVGGRVAEQVTGRRGRALYFCAGLAAASLAAWLVTLPSDPTAAFYLPLYRLWELLAGVLAFLASRPESAPRRGIAAAATCAVAVVVLWPLAAPSYVTPAAVALTAAALSQVEAAGGALPNRLLARPLPGFLGRISYSLYLYHWPLYVLAGLTIGHAPAALAATLALTLVCALLSYRFVETPLRRPWRGIPNFGVVGLSLAAMLSLAVMVAAVLPAATGGRGGLLFAGIALPLPPAATAWQQDPCHGRVRVALLADPLGHCLGARRNGLGGDLFLFGDSHAAHLLPLLRGLEGAAFRKVYFVNTEDDADFPRAFWLSPGVTQDRVLEHLLRVADAGDTFVLAFHRGRLNERRDRHIPLTQPVDLDGKAEVFVANLRPWLARLQEAGLQVIFFADTPLLTYVTAVESCLLQTRLFGHNGCTVARDQDLHTRRRQDLAFQALAEEFNNAAVYDPAPLLFGDAGRFDPVAPDGSLRMTDWHHLAAPFARTLSDDFRAFLHAQGWRPCRGAAAGRLPAGACGRARSARSARSSLFPGP